jgi:vacuolar-type H+-ATPase subunit H
MAEEMDESISVDTAIKLVLDAERDALAQIEACEKQADEIIRQARQVIRGMVRRTDQRIGQLHANCEQRNRELIAELELAARADESRPIQKDASQNRLVAAIAELARRLTTPETGSVD